MPRAVPSILVAHLRPDEVRPIIEQRFPDAPVCYVNDPGDVSDALTAHDPQIAFTIKQDGFNGTFHREILNHTGLRWFHVGGSGYEHLQPWGREDLVVTHSAGVLASYLAETVLAGMLALNGHFLTYLHRQRQRHWQPTPFRPLSEQTLLVVGLGQIGGVVAEHARHLGMQVLATRRSDVPHPAVHEMYPPEALPDLLPRADFVSLHVRLNAQTHHLIDASALALMRRGSFLVNTSRGPVVDESALADALRREHIAGAYLDVFATEPLPSESELWNLPNLLITPHSADNIGGWPGKFAELFVDNLARWLDRQPLRNVIIS
jgi:phosphoglycerate dehydrogenase-like enzyme